MPSKRRAAIPHDVRGDHRRRRRGRPVGVDGRADVRTLEKSSADDGTRSVVGVRRSGRGTNGSARAVAIRAASMRARVWLFGFASVQCTLYSYYSYSEKRRETKKKVQPSVRERGLDSSGGGVRRTLESVNPRSLAITRAPPPVPTARLGSHGAFAEKLETIRRVVHLRDGPDFFRTLGGFVGGVVRPAFAALGLRRRSPRAAEFR